MSAPPTTQGEPIEGRRQLVEYLAAGSKPRAQWRIGTEHEKFVFRLSDLRRLPYEGEGATIRGLLEGLATRHGWTPVEEAGKPIALTQGRANVTLEPGGQFELSGAPLETIHQTCDEVSRHLVECKDVCAGLGAGMLGLGFDPKWSREEVPWMPKGRYAIMRAYMQKKGRLGHDMMLRTCTVQVNLDFGDEADMVEKLRISLALQPLATALFANSPISEGKKNGYRSLRARVWTDTDPDRTGIPAVVFEDGFGFERFAEWVLDVPMYFIMRDGQWLDAAGQSFRAFLNGKAEKLAGQSATMGDWADHVTTVFTDVRLKRFLEMRGADSGAPSMLNALPACWVGLIYDDSAKKAARALTHCWSVA